MRARIYFLFRTISRVLATCQVARHVAAKLPRCQAGTHSCRQAACACVHSRTRSRADIRESCMLLPSVRASVSTPCLCCVVRKKKKGGGYSKWASDHVACCHARHDPPEACMHCVSACVWKNSGWVLVVGVRIYVRKWRLRRACSATGAHNASAVLASAGRFLESLSGFAR